MGGCDSVSRKLGQANWWLSIQQILLQPMTHTSKIQLERTYSPTIIIYNYIQLATISQFLNIYTQSYHAISALCHLTEVN